MTSSTQLINLITLPTINDDCILTVVEKDSLPFSIKRLYYISKTVPSLPRGFHAHHKTRQLLFCVQGSVKLVLDDGKTREAVILTNPNQGLLLEPMVWHEMHDMTEKTILLVLASHEYDKDDYIRNFTEFLKICHSH